MHIPNPATDPVGYVLASIYVMVAGGNDGMAVTELKYLVAAGEYHTAYVMALAIEQARMDRAQWQKAMDDMNKHGRVFSSEDDERRELIGGLERLVTHCQKIEMLTQRKERERRNAERANRKSAERNVTPGADPA